METLSTETKMAENKQTPNRNHGVAFRVILSLVSTTIDSCSLLVTFHEVQNLNLFARLFSLICILVNKRTCSTLSGDATCIVQVLEQM